MGKGMLEFTDGNFKDEALDSKLPVVVDFWATWCGPCKAIAPIMQELAAEYKGRARVGKVNVDDNPAITRDFNILNIPTLIFIKDGEEMGRLVGINSKAEISKRIEELIK